MPLYVSYVLLVVCIAVAVLRYRLYDVEVIVSRALALAIATAFVALGYVGLVVALGAPSRTGPTAASGCRCWPRRSWRWRSSRCVAAWSRLADRLAYGNRAAPYDALADFSRRIGRSPATDELLPTIAAAAGEAVQAERVVVRARRRRRGDPV